MRHRTLLVSSLAALAAAVALGVLVREPQRDAPSTSHAATPPADELALSSIPPTHGVRDDEQPQLSTAPKSQTVPPAQDRAGDRGGTRPRVDEATLREQMLRQAADDVRIAYTLLFEDLDLPEQDEKDFSALLAEMQVESAYTSYQRGKTIDPQERNERIAAVIGDEKLDAFLVLEVNRQAYWETYQIALLMQRRGVPTTPAQRDGLFDIVVEVNERYPFKEPAGLDYRSAEYIDQQLRQLDDIDRHVVELAPSVLSATQVAHLFQAYDRMSRERLDEVERQKEMKAEGRGIEGWMTPGRWSWRSVQP